MYRLTYIDGSDILIDTFSRELAEHIKIAEQKRTGQIMRLMPWRAFPDRSQLTHINRLWTTFKGGRSVNLFEVPSE